jgi:hypothetical protein
MPNVSEYRLKQCYAKFRDHCVDRHDLTETDANAHMLLDLQEWTLTLFKDE